MQEKRERGREKKEKSIVILDFKVIVEILGHLDDPRDLARAGQVCKIVAILTRMLMRMTMRMLMRMTMRMLMGMMGMVSKRAYSENMTISTQVSQIWNECSQDASLWRRLPLSQWEFSNWKFFHNNHDEDDLQPAVDLLPDQAHLTLDSDEPPEPCELFDNIANSLLRAVRPWRINFSTRS